MTPTWSSLGFIDFLISIEVHLERPLELVNDEGTGQKAKLKGFVQELAVRATDEENARAQARAHVEAYDLGPDQKFELVFIELNEIEDAPSDASAVWFESARSFYSEE